MSNQYITVKSIDEDVVQVTLNRPEKCNALNLVLMEEVSAAFEGFQDSSYRVAILAAEGPAFCTGLDLKEAENEGTIEKVAQHVARLLKAVYTSKLITIAMVQGDALAGGAGLVAACDYALIAKGACMGFPETRRGLIAAQVATLLCRQMRLRDVRELLLLGEPVSSEKAVQMGLVNRQVDGKELFSEALKVAKIILLGAPEATRDTKLLVDSLIPASFFDDLEIALSFYHTARHSDEAKEGLKAFFEKRQPQWKKS